MTVRDFLDRMRVRFAGRASALRSPQKQQAVLHPVASHASSPGGQSHAAPRHALANWLEDGRRLRVRLRLASPFAAPQDESRHSDARGQSAERPRVISGPNRRAAETEIPSSLPKTAPLIPPAVGASTTGPILFGDASLEEIEAMDASQRKLVFLGYLIRQGIYNEGFNTRELPEQYWRSQGRDDDAPSHGEDTPAN
jgi:hypothetical protein